MGEGRSQPTPRPSPSQEGEDRVRINGNYRGCSWKNCPLIFLSLSAQNASFLSFLDRKAGTFFKNNKAETFICQYFDSLSASPIYSIYSH
ncbi:hypothetical protein D4Z78_30205 [Okeania hirsuta]|nr:hypothetical protein D4Z78_30205 [Okeania hirsuta]